MVDFNKKIINSDKFRQPAITFMNTGQYCSYPQGTSEFFQFWDEERRRCIDGYTADDGDFISGYNYFYLNYCPISRIVNHIITDERGNVKVKRVNEVSFPDFWDYDYYYFNAVQEAQDQGKHLCLLKSRRKGFSYKGGAMACRNYYLIPNSKTFIYASNKQYLTDDGILTKAWDYMDFIDKNTAWGKKRTVNTQMRRRAGFITRDDYGNQIELGYKSEIIGVTLKDNPDVVRGKKANLILFEEGGSFTELGAAWQIARPSVEIDGLAFGTMIVWGTGGDEGCITENNLVYTSDGRQISIKDLTKSDKLIGYDNKNRTLTEEPVKFINIPTEKQCVKLTTNSGRTIECSIDHPIYSSNNKDYNDCLKFDWCNAGELNIGNYIAISKDIPYFGNNRIDNARAIGIFIGDGSYRDKSSVKLTSCDEEIKNYIKSIYPCSIIKSNYTKQGKKLEELSVKKAKYDINALGINNQTKQNKRLPDIINSCDKQTISELLGGLYDTDGCVSTTYSKKRNTYSTIINLTQSSKQLLEQVLLLLQKFGIRGYIYEVKHKRSKNSIVNSSESIYYSLDIHDRDSIINFRNNIKFIVKYKQDKLEKAGQYYINRRSLQKNRGFYYEKITKIENVGLKTVYNISAGLSHTYLVNGIITHNSAFETMKDMFYNPDGYNCLGFDNIWDETPSDKKCGFFVPQYTNLDIRDEKGNRVYMDKDGNTFKKKSLEYILEERRKVVENATNSVAVDRYVAERPITPQEAMLEFNGNIFPKKELQEQLAKIRINKHLSNHKQVGDLIWDSNGQLKWVQKKHGDITHYPLGKEDDPTGSIVIWEHPVKDAPNGLYIMGCLTPGEKVLTDKGLVNVEDIDFSYKLVNRYGEYDRIINLQRYNKVNEPVFRIKPTGSYRTTQFTGEHPILLSDNIFVKAKDLKVGNELVIPNRYTTVKNDYYSIIQNELGVNPNNHKLWRFFGIWLGDGFNNINRNSYDIYVAFGKNQIEQANNYSELISDIFDRKTVWCKSNGGQTRRFTNKRLVEFLDKYFGKYAENKKIPEWLMYIPEEYKKSFIFGYLDSDGSVFKDRTHYKVTFTSINLTLLEQIQQLLYSIRICSSITLKSKAGDYTINNKIQHRLDAYCLKIASQDTLLLLDNIDEIETGFKLKLLHNYDRSKLSKRPRHARISEDGKFIYLKIQSIEQGIYTGTVYNFECESHTYMCHDIVSHNCDPYDHDQSGTNSLGSVFVYKRFQNFENYYDIIVAEYTGRPATAEEYYENLRKLAVYYNGRIMYENERKGLFPYFTAKHCDYLLADQPDIISDIVSNSKVQRKKGCHMNKQIKQWGEGLIKDWLNEEKSPGKKNLTEILSEPLLEELISYNDTGNFDRVMALMQIMIYREQLYNVKVKEKKEENKNRILFDGPIFTQEWFRDDETYNNTEAYMF